MSAASPNRLRSRQGGNDGADKGGAARAALVDQASQHAAHALKVSDAVLHLLQLGHGQPLRFGAASLLLQAEETADFLQSEAELLRPFDEAHPVHDRAGIAAHAPQGLFGFVHQLAPLVEANRLHVDPGGAGHLPDSQRLRRT